MECPKCGEKTVVKDSRQHDSGAWRRRRWCPGCEHRFPTVEVVADRKRKGKYYFLCWKGSEDGG